MKKEIKEILDDLLDLVENESTLNNIEQIVRMIYMSENDELVAATLSREYQFRNLTVKVFHG